MAHIKLQNWKRSITYHAHSAQTVRSEQDIVAIVKDRDAYPSPVRVKGSHHSTTECVVAENGTVIDVSALNKVLHIDRDKLTITMQAGVLHIDAARMLEEHGLQFYVNVELGNLTVGSGACGGTKDASYYSARDGWEFGQVASYVCGIKYVDAHGDLKEVTEQDGEALQLMRSSYGMLGVIYEVTYRVKPLTPLAVEHVRYHIDEFTSCLDALLDGDRSVMMYLFPFLDSVVVEYRYDGQQPLRSRSWQWRVRNYAWKTLAPAVGRTLGMLVPFRRLRSRLIDLFNRVTQWVETHVLHGVSTSPADQIIRYPETAGYSAYTFSIWAFPRESYADTLRAYFAFCKEYFDRTSYRCDMLNVGYHIIQDTSSLFSYTRKGPALTLDPVSTGAHGWNDFIAAYNDFCSQRGGTPLFNQPPRITPQQAKAAFGEEIATFQRQRRRQVAADGALPA